MIDIFFSTEKDYSKLIIEEMSFFGLKQFSEKCYNIKRCYNFLEGVDRRNFKEYVYHRPLLKTWEKDLIWNFLNLYPDEPDYITKQELLEITKKGRL